MALSYNQSIDLSDNTFSFSFDYINLEDVQAIGQRISDDVWVQLTVTARDPDAKTVTVSDVLTPYDKVQVYRQTSIAPLVDFQNGARLTERDLDSAYRQGLYAAQEVAENANQSTQREDVDTDLIANGAISTLKIANGAVTDQKLATTLDLSTHSVTLATGEIGASELADDAVDSEHLVDGSVDNVHLAGSIDLTTKVTGELPVANGGTGVTTALPFTVSFASEESLPSFDTTISEPHLLGQTPKLITAHLKCTSDINGYTVGDIVALGASDEALPYNVFADDDNVYFRRDGDIGIVNNSAVGHFNVSSTNFTVVISAYA